MVLPVRTFGTPAGTLAAASGNKYEARRASAGTRGERDTANLFEKTFQRDDNIWCYHDLWMPGGRGRNGETANIDHVLVTGQSVVVIDTKVWKPATYWTFRGTTRRGFTKTNWADKSGVGMAVDRLSERLPDINVAGVTLVWPSGPGNLSLLLHRAPGGYRSYPADSPATMRVIRRLLGTSTEPHPAIPALLSTLLPRRAAG